MPAPPTRFRSVFGDVATAGSKQLAGHLNEKMADDHRLLTDLRRWDREGLIEVKRVRAGRSFVIESAKLTAIGKGRLTN